MGFGLLRLVVNQVNHRRIAKRLPILAGWRSFVKLI